MHAQDAFDQLVREWVAPLLRERGYRKTRLTWHREEDGDWLVVNIQKSAWTGQTEVEFMVNLGVALTERRGHGFDWPDGKRPPIHRCHHHVRLETLLKRGRSWRVTPRSNIDRIGRELRRDLENVGLAWLDREGRAEADREVDKREAARRAQ